MPAYVARIVDLFREIVRQEEAAVVAASARSPEHPRGRSGSARPPQQRGVVTGEPR
jgi:hypothetical protein